MRSALQPWSSLDVGLSDLRVLPVRIGILVQTPRLSFVLFGAGSVRPSFVANLHPVRCWDSLGFLDGLCFRHIIATMATLEGGPASGRRWARLRDALSSSGRLESFFLITDRRKEISLN